MQLNETLNQKCAITFAAKTKVSKVKKTATTMKPTRNVKNKSDSTKMNSFALADAKQPTNDTKVVATNSNGSGNEIDQPASEAAKVENVTDTDTTNAPDNRDSIEKFLADFSVESKIKLTNDFPDAKCETADPNVANENAKPTNGISLIPNNLVRRNVSTDGIIK